MSYPEPVNLNCCGNCDNLELEDRSNENYYENICKIKNKVVDPKSLCKDWKFDRFFEWERKTI